MTFTRILPHSPPPPGQSCEWAKTDEGCYWCCDVCNSNRHICPGCGEPLSHLGNELVETIMGDDGVVKEIWQPHEGCID
jgi:hypothetical protein